MSSLPSSSPTVRDRLNLRGRASGLIWSQSSLGLHEVGCEDSVDQGRFSKASLTCITLVWLLLQRRALVCNAPTQMTLNWNPRLSSLRSIWLVMLSKPTWLSGCSGCWSVDITTGAAMMLMCIGLERQEWKCKVRSSQWSCS